MNDLSILPVVWISPVKRLTPFSSRQEKSKECIRRACATHVSRRAPRFFARIKAGVNYVGVRLGAMKRGLKLALPFNESRARLWTPPTP